MGGPPLKGGGWLYSILCDMSMGGDPHRGGGLYSILCDMSILAPPPSPLSLFTKCRPSLRLACT